MKSLLEEVIKNAGEGIILRKPKSMYESGRSEDLLKLKVK
jgi:ATP-dependent DNA ligase